MKDRLPATPARVWFRLLRLHHRGHQAIGQRLRSIGLSIAQFDLLSTLSEREGITQRDLAERLYVTKGNVSGLVDRLVEANLVERRAIIGDRRSYALYLTVEGRRLFDLGMGIQNHFIAKTVGQLPAAELQTLDLLLTNWREALRALDAPEIGADASGATSRPSPAGHKKGG